MRAPTNSHKDPKSNDTTDVTQIFGQKNLDDYLYFEFEIKINKQKNNSLKDDNEILFSIRDISNIVICQRKISDKIYQDALVANYSHEQYTPLNNILTGSRMVEKQMEEIFKADEERYGTQNKI